MPPDEETSAGGKLNVFTLGALGVNRVSSPVQVRDGELLQAQNALAATHGTQLALSKRWGMVPLNVTTASGTILAMTSVPFPDPGGYPVPGVVTIDAAPNSVAGPSSDNTFFTTQGSADFGDCAHAAADGKNLNLTNVQFQSAGVARFYFEDNGSIPMDATITYVKLSVLHKAAGADLGPAPDAPQAILSWVNDLNQTFALVTPLWDPPADASGYLESTSYVTWSRTMTVNPQSGVAWTRAEIFEGFGVEGQFSIACQPGNPFSTDDVQYDIDHVSLEIGIS